MHTASLKLQSGHLYISLNGHDWLLDTGAPTSFGDIQSIQIGEEEFIFLDNYMGLTASQLSEFTDHSLMGIIGADVLNMFNVLIDVPGKAVSFSRDAVALDGSTLTVDEFMGIPIVLVGIGGTDRRMFFDTGAQISYFQDESIKAFPSAGKIDDFYPGVGSFQTETYMVDAIIGSEEHSLRCGSLPESLGMTLMMAGVEGIVGNEILTNRIVGYFSKQRQLVLA